MHQGFKGITPELRDALAGLAAKIAVDAQGCRYEAAHYRQVFLSELQRLPLSAGDPPSQSDIRQAEAEDSIQAAVQRILESDRPARGAPSATFKEGL